MKHDLTILCQAAQPWLSNTLQALWQPLALI